MEIRKGFRKTETEIIPEDWNVKMLKDVADFFDGKRKPIKDSERAKMKGDYPYYGASGIIDYVNDYLFDEELILIGEDGENIVSRNLPLVFKVSGKVWVNNHAHVLKPKKGIDIGYLTEKLESLNYEQYNTGTAQPKLNQRVCSEIPIAIPNSYEEQTAIATALSDTDTLISSLSTLIAKKHNIKQGAMQQLLQPKEGWEVEKLRNIVDKITTGKLDANAMASNGEYRFYTCAKDYSFINEYAFDDEALLVSGNGANVGYIHYYKGRFNAYQRTYVITGFRADVFYVKIFMDMYLSKRIASEVSAGNTPYIKLDTIAEMEIHLPKTIAEQNEVSSTIIEITNEIEALEIKLEKYKQIKKGMMQRLLTGKIRLV